MSGTAANAPAPLERGRGFSTGFWLSLAAVAAVSAGLFFYKLGSLPWDHDEVAGLIEVGALDMTVSGAPVTQLEKVKHLLPVWWGLQKVTLNVFPADEFGTRVLSATSGVLVVVSAFAFGWRWRGPGFAFALALVLGMSQSLIWLSQHNRFYSPAFLFLTWSLVVLWWPTGREAVAAGACVALTLAAILCHNLLVVVYGIVFLAAAPCYLVGAVPRFVVVRATVMAATAACTYLVYLRPLLAGWVSGDTGGTHPLVSFAALIGVPTLALATVGAARAVAAGVRGNPFVWWVVALVGGVMFIALSPKLMGNWNPRYAVLLVAPVWVLAAHGVAAVAEALGSPLGRAGWYAAVALLLLPKLASHWQDGSRHDLRVCAPVAARHVQDGEVVLCNWPMEMAYYLRGHSPVPVVGWFRGGQLPDGGCVVVYASNAYEPVLRPAGRMCEVVAEYSPRRFDEQSHFVRVYRLGPAARSK